MTQKMRLAGGALIDRARPVSFTFDGRRLQGFAGDTLASALMANGVRLAARSFKYHRPRGILTAGSEEPNALVSVSRGGGRRTPNLRATMVELYDGLAASSQNRFPSLGFDVGALADRAAPVLGAGFYYKTFIGPRGFWEKVYEPVIRQSAGLGVAPAEADPDRYAARYAHCDVLVVGGGPAGLAAARAAAEAGARVILCDERATFGGMAFDAPDDPIDGKTAAAWRCGALQALEACANVRLLPRTTAFALYPDNFALLCERVGDHLAAPDPRLPRERLWRVQARRVVLATGAIEQPLVFADNDRPGVMLASAALSYARRWGAAAGRRAVLVAADDDAWERAFALHTDGIDIALIADLRASAPDALMDAARALSIPTVLTAQVGRVFGERSVRAIEINEVRIACDLVLMSAGWAPTLHLYAQAGGGLAYDAGLKLRLPDGALANVACVGACNGAATSADAVVQGAAAFADALPPPRRRLACAGDPVAGAAAGKAFVDFQSDVTTKDIRLALQEGFESVEHLKRYTTTGMGVDQGKTSNLAALAVASRTLGRDAGEMGLTTFRMPFTPVSFGAMAGGLFGTLFDPVRKTPIDPWAAENGAVFEPVGTWRRARYFPRADERMHDAVARECRTVREAVGLFDASTLGKIEVCGADAAAFLERLYVNRWRKLGVGRCRYGLLLKENGFIFDDGVVGRLADDRFHVTTTTGGVHGVLAHMEDYLQTEWPDLDVWLTDVTEQWAVIALQGPMSRTVLADLLPDVDLADAATPHMSVRETSFDGGPARLFRVSFTGERGYELNVPAERAGAAWERLCDRVIAAGGCAYGTEAMHVLRAEKGYIIIGQETDGTVAPDDVGFGAMLGKKTDFVGKRSLSLEALAASGRKQLVGLLTELPAVVPEEGAQVSPASNGVGALAPPIGHVASAYWSAALGRSIALALVENGRDRMGERVLLRAADRPVPATIVAPVFYDPEGARLNA